MSAASERSMVKHTAVAPTTIAACGIHSGVAR
jgi:hypothetical protein